MGVVDVDIGGLADSIMGGFDSLFTSDEEREAKRIELVALRQKPAEGQVETNKIEAAHRSIFVAGWRPAIGWVCASGLAWHFLLYPFGTFLCDVFKPELVLPAIDSNSIIDLVIAMLGLGAYRSYEKIKGKAK